MVVLLQKVTVIYNVYVTKYLKVNANCRKIQQSFDYEFKK